MKWLLIALFVWPMSVWADEAPKPIPAKVGLIFPSFPSTVPVIPAPGPVTPTPVETVPVLTAGQWYVVQSDTEFFLLASPAKLVTIQYELGPLRIKGIFADGSEKVETRNYGAKYLAIVDAAESQNARVELIGVPAGITDESAITRRLIDIGSGPIPPPNPPPIPPPNPPGPSPIPAGEVRVMLISESSKPLTKEQQSIFLSPKIRAYLDEKCAKGPGGRPEWRRWDPDIEIAATESRDMREMWESVKPKVMSLPAIAIVKGKSGFVFPLPATEEATLELLKQYTK